MEKVHKFKYPECMVNQRGMDVVECENKVMNEKKSW